MTDKKLEACPHCAGKAELEDWTCAYESGTTIRCLDCGACASESVEGGDGWHDRAVEKWNRRTPPAADSEALTSETTAQKQEIERLTTALRLSIETHSVDDRQVNNLMKHYLSMAQKEG